VVEKDVRDIGSSTVDEAHRMVKQGVQSGINEKVERGIDSLLHDIFRH